MINKIIAEDIKKYGIPTTLSDCEIMTKRCMKALLEDLEYVVESSHYNDILDYIRNEKKKN